MAGSLNCVAVCVSVLKANETDSRNGWRYSLKCGATVSLSGCGSTCVFDGVFGGVVCC